MLVFARGPVAEIRQRFVEMSLRGPGGQEPVLGPYRSAMVLVAEPDDELGLSLPEPSPEEPLLSKCTPEMPGSPEHSRGSLGYGEASGEEKIPEPSKLGFSEEKGLSSRHRALHIHPFVPLEPKG